MATQERPKLIWVISIFYLFSAGWTLLSFYLIFAGKLSLSPAVREYFNNLSYLDWASSLLPAAANFTGAIALFLMRRAAYYLLSSGLIIGLLLTIWQIVSKNWLQAIGGPGLVGALIALGISISICVYSKNLLRDGIPKIKVRT